MTNNIQKKLINSPCVRNCCLDEDDICLGCFRHIDEIIAWRSFNNQEKQQVITLCHQRQDNSNHNY
ncbi:DUF1289 domain-containing protein [Colwellia psychrerythraea]|nr:DUF1289 domain-containing protein [Colwellia psychrerythraea]